MCQQVHHMQVQVLEAYGIDACREYEQSKVEHVIEAVQVRDKECPLHKKPLKILGCAIKTHLRAKHMDITPFSCKECSKSFGKNQLLRSHMKTHQTNKFPSTSEDCEPSFRCQGRLNSNLKTHGDKNQVQCLYCAKVFKAKKSLKPHEKTCKDRSGGKEAVVRYEQCQYCPKAYIHQKNLKYHVDHAHTSRASCKDSKVAP